MSTKDKKILVVIFTFVLIIAGLVLGLNPYFKKLNEYDELIKNRTTKINSLKVQAANKPLLEDELNRINKVISSSDVFIKANDSSAESLFLADSRKIILEAGGDIKTSRITNNKKTNSLIADISFEISNEGFSSILQTISTARPVINIKKMSVTPVRKNKRIVDPKNKRKRRLVVVDTGKLKVTLSVESFYTGRGNAN